MINLISSKLPPNESSLQKLNTDHYFMFSALTFRVQKAHLFQCPLAVAFANDTNICLCFVLSLMQPSLCMPCNNFLWSEFKPNLLMLVSVCHHTCHTVTPSSNGQQGDKRSPSMFSGDSWRQERAGWTPNFPLPDRNWKLFPFFLCILFPMLPLGAGKCAQGRWKWTRSTVGLWKLVLLRGNSSSCDAFP